ncbi:MAG: hypothetical protein JO111_00010 [Caulobacteraceae bacterium]|nr:hypothetical protein [Caulobacteraceae bacterium]
MKLAALFAVVSSFALPGVLGADPTVLGVGYICSAEHEAPSSAPVQAIILPGVGNGAMRADTANAQAQTWFDEGRNLYHAFDHIQARAAFARAAALDPTCALCEWGVALGLGPTLNYPVTASERAEALAHARRAAELIKPGDARARGLIGALLIRYGEDPQRDQLYAAAMENLANRYPGDDAIAADAAHALMIPGRGSDLKAVARAETLLKGILARHPDDTAAIHYYIHATEFAGHPADALAYAQRLAVLAPGASHLVHMAAHTMIHVGLYEQVALVDAEALAVDAKVRTELREPGPLGAEMYYIHNYVFGLEGALMSGDGPLALKYAEHAGVAFPAAFDTGVVTIPAGMDRRQDPVERRVSAEARALVALGRFAPEKALALPDDPIAPPGLRLWRRYARGEALAAHGDGEGVRREAQAITALASLPSGVPGANEADFAATALIAADVLEGRAALIRGAPDEAATAFARAADREEKAFPYARRFDPPPWWYPVRRSLAYADLAAGRPADAEREAETSLKAWPQDALALRVLADAEAKLGETQSAARHRAEARHAWRGDLAKTPMRLT